jgi:hypothetical protein
MALVEDPKAARGRARRAHTTGRAAFMTAFPGRDDTSLRWDPARLEAASRDTPPLFTGRADRTFHLAVPSDELLDSAKDAERRDCLRRLLPRSATEHVACPLAVGRPGRQVSCLVRGPWRDA